jgi:uncharacterized protein
MKPFIQNVADLVHRPGAHRRMHLEAPLGEDLQVASSTLSARDDVVIDLLLSWATEGLLATGTVAAPFTGECRRCLGPLVGEVVADVQELFEEEPREGESYPLRHETIDLEPLAREALLLGLPLAPLCREDCRGLCPTCGVDLNETPDHEHPERDERWAALDALRTDPS